MKTFKTSAAIMILLSLPFFIHAQNVGIGTSTPNSKLTVVDTVPNTINIKTLDNDKSTGISFQNSGGNYAWNLFRKPNLTNQSDFIIAGGAIEANINDLAERFKITKDGNTIINGTTTLNSTLLANNDIIASNGNVVFNEDGQDKDFRIEGLTKDTLFFVDGNEDRIGINTNTPSAILDVVGNTELNGQTILNGNVFTTGNSVFNTMGEPNNFRIESDTSTHMFFLSGPGNRIGINTSTPMAGFDVNTNTLFRKSSVFNPLQNPENFRIATDNKFAMFFVDGAADQIGIGHNNPSAELDIIGDLEVNGDTELIGNTAIDGNIITSGSAIFNENAMGVDFRVESKSQPNMLLVKGSTNRVGIKTSTPTAELDVNGSTELDELTVRGNTVFNEGGINYDFRIEGESEPYLFFSDASQDRIGINTNNPSARLDVVGFTELNGKLIVVDGDVVFNEDADNRDFRVEGVSQTHALFVKASNNSVGIATNNPSARLDVVGTTELNGKLTVVGGGAVFNEGAFNSDFRIEGTNLDTLFFVDASADRIGINTSNPTATMDVAGDFAISHAPASGNIWPVTFSNSSVTDFLGGLRLNNNGFVEMTNTANVSGANKARLDNTGTWTAVSDRRLKTNIIEAENLLEKTLLLNPVHYTFKTDEKKENQLGLIAQDVKEVFPEFVTEGDVYTLNYSGLSVAAIGAIKELNEEKIKLEERIVALEKANEELSAQVAAIEAFKAQIKKEILAEMNTEEIQGNHAAEKE